MGESTHAGSPHAGLPSGRREPAAQRCPRCGGSGVLRLSDQKFRTCLDCLGQGRLPQFSIEPSLEQILRRQEANALSADSLTSGAR
ncbi:hypothetical protein KBY97_08145 [Synechococcus sp. ATX 2A4]|uniref:hypothetical protein n=1 Tax=Synechococcus sp. ATX 2A4 TaxID=2823727 RepID=UPI0020CDA53F|nr:hypothetical protein [Synechococcus sp. ATX 2A4]MCP9885095.1 hypothetical protein [Synechococcus sp. ATX 2A4]